MSASQALFLSASQASGSLAGYGQLQSLVSSLASSVQLYTTPKSVRCTADMSVMLWLLST